MFYFHNDLIKKRNNFTSIAQIIIPFKNGKINLINLYGFKNDFFFYDTEY